MNVINYIKENGFEKLKEEFHISVKEYEDRYVLNYDQIESPRFHPIVDECRGLIIDKNFNIMCRSFHRFFNFGEGIEGDKFAVKDSNGVVHPKDIKDAKVYHKMDGTLINLYWDYLKDKWQVATRGMAFAEGGNEFFDSFEDLVKKSNQYDTIIFNLNEWAKEDPYIKGYTYLFELTSPFNRIVTPYDQTELTLLAIKTKWGNEYARKGLEYYSVRLGVKLPPYYEINDWNELTNLVNSFPSMQEGVVLVWEDTNREEGHYRLKCKNVQYVAIHNLRSNGLISPYRILTLIMGNEEEEYLSYFEEDRKYFDFVKNEWNKFLKGVEDIYNQFKDIESQKDFALAVMANIPEKFYSGFLFDMRKGKSLKESLDKFNGDGKKLSKAMNLKEKFMKEFNLKIEEEE
jgi:hypothetical protein